MVGMKTLVPTNGRPYTVQSSKERYTHHEVIACRAGNPSGRT
jgi:hypothetical protein